MKCQESPENQQKPKKHMVFADCYEKPGFFVFCFFCIFLVFQRLKKLKKNKKNKKTKKTKNKKTKKHKVFGDFCNPQT